MIKTAVRGKTHTCIQQVPSLWRQIAEQHAHVALFGVVRQSEADLLDRFSITSHDLPKVVIFCPGVCMCFVLYYLI